MSCRDCIHLHVPRGPAKEHRPYRCMVDVPDTALPACMTAASGFRMPLRVPLVPSAGDGCRYFQPRETQ